MSVIKCCRYCVPPKRKPGCHDHCPGYQKELAKGREWRAKMNKEHEIDQYAITVINKKKRRRER